MPLVLLSMPRQPQDMLLQRLLRNLGSSINLQGFTNIKNVIFEGFFYLSASRWYLESEKIKVHQSG